MTNTPELREQLLQMACEWMAIASFGRVGPGNFTRASHRSGLDTLASFGSCHRTKATAFR